jgi:TPR repeat protein
MRNFLALWTYYGQAKFEESIKKFRSLAEIHHPDALFNLGVIYHRGDGVPKDNSMAVMYWRRAADLGHTPSMNSAGTTLTKGEEGIFYWLIFVYSYIL